MNKLIFKIILAAITLSACCNDIKFETSKAINNYYNWGKKYRAFYLVSNYNNENYNKVKKFVHTEFFKVIQKNDSIVYLQFNFYKKNWNTSRFLSDDPYGHHSPLLPENNVKYGKYCIGGFFYDRIENSNKWVYHTFKNNFTDTIEVKINK